MNKLKIARITKDLQQIDVAKHIGVTQGRYSKIERGKASLTLKQGLILMELLEIDVDDFPEVNNTKRSESLKGEKNSSFIHGCSHTKEYKVWSGMKRRCYNAKHKDYKNYGARGIKVCEKWLNDFTEFRNWALTNGCKEGLEIDRIDNNGDYSPNNCRFVTKIQNCNNKRNNHILEYKGEKMTIAEMARKYNIGIELFRTRISKGWDIERALVPRKYNNTKGVQHG